MPNNNSQEYENSTRKILNDDRIRPYLDLNRIEAEKCLFPGKKTGTGWEADAFGYDLDGGLVLIECKHYKKDRLNQNQVGGFAYTIQDVGAKRGIIVTTFGLQSGAIKVAKAENITLIRLDYNSTDKNFTVHLVNRAVIQITDQFNSISFSPGIARIKKYSQEELLKRIHEDSTRENPEIK
ncbi:MULTISPECIES: restriction endonuclease [Cyanophyceae]|uniref:restriction endonuclease n=1 Tax=Cyanophyceae TaxID=3028117 RepID=UPI0016837BA1|nr:restriction endonuclease [Trichocoleus sp. FACHB-69]MBD1933951.1 restriction endonuclease [Trichocoleus sp. FACHB-69]